MFNNRDEKLELPADFYNPYKIGNYIENIHTQQIAKIISIIETENERKVLLQTDIRHETKEGVVEISYKELTTNWLKTERITIKRMPTEKERLNLGITFPETNLFTNEVKLKLKK